MADTQLWSNLSAVSGWFHEKGDVKSGLVAGVFSCSSADIDTFDGTTYRDAGLQLPAGSAFASATGILSLTGSNAAQSYVVADTTAGAAPTLSAVPASGTANVAITTTNDDLLHIPPRSTPLKRTLLKFWSAATGTGNVLYAVWADRFISFEVSADPPTFI